MATLTSSATAGADTRSAAVAANIPRLRMAVPLLLVDGLHLARLFKSVRDAAAILSNDAIIVPVLVRIDILSAALEAGNEFVRLAWIDQAHGRQRPRAAPGVAVDHKAGCADRNVERRR